MSDIDNLRKLLEAIAEIMHSLSGRELTALPITDGLSLLRSATNVDRVCLAFTGEPQASAGETQQVWCVGEQSETPCRPLPEDWIEKVSAGESLKVTAASADDEERTILTQLGIADALIIPLLTEQHIYRGTLRLENSATMREWLPIELTALKSVVNAFCGVLIQRAALGRMIANEARYQRMMENSPDVYYSMTLPDGVYEYVSPAAKEVFGYAPDEIQKRPLIIRDAIHPGWRRYFEEQWENLLEGNIPPTYEYAIIHGVTGEPRWLHQRNVLIRDDEGRPSAIEGVITDVTARKLAENELQVREATLGSIARAAPIGIGLVSERILLNVNDRICEMTGYTRDELIGKSARLLYPSEKEFRWVGEVKYDEMHQEGTGTVETRWRRKDGSIIDVLLSSTPLDRENFAEGVTFTALDITARKEAEAQIREALREKETLLQEIHHRVKNNLAVVSSLLGLQALQMDDTALQTALEASRDRIDAIARVHEHLYRWPNLTHVSMRSYVSELIADLDRSYSSRKITYQIEVEDVFLNLDQAMPCGLILNELVTNALQHAFATSTEAAHKETPLVRVALRASKDRCELVVSDNGVGLPPDVDFNRPDSLGLHLIQLLTNQLKGTLSVREDIGTAISIDFPLTDDVAEMRRDV
jgi:PAS domain S-box-containing protein